MITRIEKLAWNKDYTEVEQIREAIPFEVKKLLNHMEGLSEERMITSLERNLNNLYVAYFSIDKELKELPKEERDNLRAIKNVIYEAISVLISRSKLELNIQCSQEFIYNWINKVDYFPFGEAKKVDARHKRIDNIPKQEIETEALKTYFKSKFKGMGGSMDYFSVFTDDLKTLKQPIDFARVALMCYEGRQMNDSKPATFSRWYRTFCKIVGCIHTTMDNKNKIRSNIPQNMKDRFSYLD
jgi:hypothetical protein